MKALKIALQHVFPANCELCTLLVRNIPVDDEVVYRTAKINRVFISSFSAAQIYDL